jgi:3-methyladenine DNA glycosylase AlkC
LAALKELLNPAAVRKIGAAIAAAHPEFPENAFVKHALKGLPALELKGRVVHIAQSLRAFLPEDYEKCLSILVKASRTKKNPRGVDGFVAWPFTQFIETYGQSDPQASLGALKIITEAMSAEFAVRPFLLRHQDKTLALMAEWARDENVHVRRLASEGTRPRLPWGQRLKEFQANPELAAPILRQLRTDPELYVRKSVANHLNDFSKDHPEWLVTELRRWKEELPGHAGVQWIIRHACRSLVKAGHKETLELLGFGAAAWGKAALKVSPARLKLGESLALEFTAVAKQPGRWVVDYAIHHRKKDGRLSPKVFKWKALVVKRGQRVELAKKHAVKLISTRKYYAGRHEVEIFVNGKSAAKGAFHLSLG